MLILNQSVGPGQFVFYQHSWPNTSVFIQYILVDNKFSN